MILAADPETPFLSTALRHFLPTVSYCETGGTTYTPPISLWDRNPTTEPGIAIRGALSALVTFRKKTLSMHHRCRPFSARKTHGRDRSSFQGNQGNGHT